MTCRPENAIRPSDRREFIRYRDGDTADIIETILYADKHSGRWILPGVECLVGSTDYRTLYNVWAFVKKNVRYVPDRRGYEKVKSPAALFYMGTGDCKSFSVATGAILQAFGIPYSYRFAAYEPGDYTHVYVVAHTGGGPVILDSVYDYFDAEESYLRHTDIPAPKSPAIGGIGNTCSKGGGLLIGALIGYLIGKYL